MSSISLAVITRLVFTITVKNGDREYLESQRTKACLFPGSGDSGCCAWSKRVEEEKV